MVIFKWQFQAANYFILYLISITSDDSLDWKDYGADSIIKTVTEHKHLGSGSIILCHNGAKYTAQALDMLIANLKNDGYTFMPISELFSKTKFINPKFRIVAFGAIF